MMLILAASVFSITSLPWESDPSAGPKQHSLPEDAHKGTGFSIATHNNSTFRRPERGYLDAHPAGP